MKRRVMWTLPFLLGGCVLAGAPQPSAAVTSGRGDLPRSSDIMSISGLGRMGADAEVVVHGMLVARSDDEKQALLRDASGSVVLDFGSEESLKASGVAVDDAVVVLGRLDTERMPHAIRVANIAKLDDGPATARVIGPVETAAAGLRSWAGRVADDADEKLERADSGLRRAEEGIRERKRALEEEYEVRLQALEKRYDEMKRELEETYGDAKEGLKKRTAEAKDALEAERVALHTPRNEIREIVVPADVVTGSARNTTIAESMKLRNGEEVLLRGYIRDRLDDGRYILVDDSGKIHLRIDQDLLKGREPAPSELILVRGRLSVREVDGTDHYDVDVLEVQ